MCFISFEFSVFLKLSHELISLHVDVFYVSNKEICWADFLFVSLSGSLSSEDALVVLENK